jgi:hypothetical protein
MASRDHVRHLSADGCAVIGRKSEVDANGSPPHSRGDEAEALCQRDDQMP